MHGLHLLAAHFINQIFLIGTVYVFVKCLNGCRLKPVPFLVCTMLGLWKIKAYTWVNTNTCWSQCRFNIGIAGFCVFSFTTGELHTILQRFACWKPAIEMKSVCLTYLNATAPAAFAIRQHIYYDYCYRIRWPCDSISRHSTPNQPSIEALI